MTDQTAMPSFVAIFTSPGSEWARTVESTAQAVAIALEHDVDELIVLEPAGGHYYVHRPSLDVEDDDSYLQGDWETEAEAQEYADLWNENHPFGDDYTYAPEANGSRWSLRATRV